ncbi:MAG: extracellular solute-binding protein [Ruminococcus flavefaciens]|nr:extracellular solute-binding protein [Ruminococcus flavefaciens]MCM1228569.1 extracellular solute-binding protein [Ruminococcus flavefaciens]
MIKKFFCCFISLMIIFLSLPEYSAIAEGADYYCIEPESPYVDFDDYYNMYCNENRPDSRITVAGTDYISADGGFSVGSYGSDGETRDNVLIWESGTGEISYNINVTETGIYCLGVNYFPIESDSPEIELAIRIDDEIPYDTASRIVLKRVWINDNDIYTDSRGNQVRPSQVQHGMWQECTVKDPDGLFSEPLFFYLTEGVHKISFSSERAEFALESFEFFNPAVTESYKTPPDLESSASNIFRIEGENALYKSDAVLSPTYDNSSCKASPADPVKVVYNTIGADGSWKDSLQSLTWVISAEEVQEGGWFRLGIKARQNQMRGLYSNRRILIDGETPCRELEQVKFYYDKDWSITTPQTESGEDIYVYLEGGMNHTITMECVTGEIGESLRKLDSVVDRLNEYYRKILMVTGPYPDKYTDYYVQEKIPGLVDGLDGISRELRDIQAEIETVSTGSEVALLGNMAVILDKCVEKPLKIPDYLSQIKENITSVSAVMRDYCEQPLEIDYIEFATCDRQFEDCKEGIFESIWFAFKSFAGSFFEDYTTLSDIKDEEAVEVWVALGRDEAQIVRELTESGFMADYDIPVSVNLVSGGIVEATLSGKEPDSALFLGGEFPVNLASRGLLADISQYEGFGNVAERFQKNALTHYQYQGGTYGLPITQSFPMMFYRIDILSELGITSPPETWDNLIDMLPALQRNYMSAGLVLPSTNISPATESGHTFAMLMLQQGTGYYSDDMTASVLDSTSAVQAFERWTDFYTNYSFEQSYDAFSRFRTGEYPIVIANYSFAGQLETASPEINGLWDFCPVPGTLRDGNLYHTANSTGTGAVIFSSSDKKEQAWEFIKWFTQDDIQARFGSRREGMLGTIGRFETANINALGHLSWSENQLERLRKQQSELEEIPIIPASYAVTRNIMNAFRETVNEGENPRDMLVWYNRDINDEIERKNNG